MPQLTLVQLDRLMERPGPYGRVPFGLAPEECAVPTRPRLHAVAALGGVDATPMDGGAPLATAMTNGAHAIVHAGAGAAGGAALTTYDEEAEEAELTRRVRAAHAAARSLNRQLAYHTIGGVWRDQKGPYSQLRPEDTHSIDDVIVAALRERAERRKQRKEDAEKAKRMRRHRGQRGAGDDANAPVDLKSCEAARAERDVLRLRNVPGDEEAAAAIDEHITAHLAGRTLPPPVYGEVTTAE